MMEKVNFTKNDLHTHRKRERRIFKGVGTQ